MSRKHGGKKFENFETTSSCVDNYMSRPIIIVVKNAVIVLARLRALWFNVCLVTTGLKQTSYSSLEIIGSRVISYFTADNII